MALSNKQKLMEKPIRSRFDSTDDESDAPVEAPTPMVSTTDEDTPTSGKKGRGESMDDFLLRMAQEHQQQLEANRKRKEAKNGISQTLPNPKTTKSTPALGKESKGATLPTSIQSAPHEPVTVADDDDDSDSAETSSDSADSNDEADIVTRRGVRRESEDEDDEDEHKKSSIKKHDESTNGQSKSSPPNELNKSSPPSTSPTSSPTSTKPAIPGTLPTLKPFNKPLPMPSNTTSSTSTPASTSTASSSSSSSSSTSTSTSTSPTSTPHILSPSPVLAKAHEKIDPKKKPSTSPSPPSSTPSPPPTPILSVPTHSLLITNVNTQRMLKGHNMTRYIHSAASSRSRQKAVLQKHVTVFFALGDEEMKKGPTNAAASLGCIWWCDQGTRQRTDKNVLYLTDILHVYLGKQMDIWDTDVGRSAKDTCVWTLISDHEAIHFETATPQDRHTWIDGLSFIMKSCGRSMSVQQQEGDDDHGHGTPAPGSKIQISYSSVGGSGHHKRAALSKSRGSSRNSKTSSRGTHPSAMISLSGISNMSISDPNHDDEHSERYDVDESETLSLSSDDDEPQDVDFLEEEKATSPPESTKSPIADTTIKSEVQEQYQEVWRSPSPSVLADTNVQTMLRGSLFTLYSYTYASPSIANLDPMSPQAQSSIIAIQSHIFLFYVPTFGGSRGSICWSEPPSQRPITHATPRTVNASNCVDFDELMDIYVGKHTEIFATPVAAAASEDRCMTLVGGEDSEPVFDDPEPDYTGLSQPEIRLRQRARSEERRRIKESLKRIELNLEAESASELNAWVDGLTHILVNCGKDVVLVKEETPAAGAAAVSSPSSSSDEHMKPNKQQQQPQQQQQRGPKGLAYGNGDMSPSISSSNMSSMSSMNPAGVSISTSSTSNLSKSSKSGWGTATSLGSGGMNQGAAAVASGAGEVNPVTGSIRRKISVSRNRMSRAIDVNEISKSGSGSAKYIKFQQMLRDGGVFKKWKHKRPVKRRIWCSPNMDHLIWGDLSKKVIKGFLLSKEITSVKQVYEGNSNRIFLHSAHRLLELEAPSLELAKEWMQAFDFLINVHNREMARIFQEKSSGPRRAEFEAMQATMAKRLQDGDVFRYRSPQKPFKKEAYKLRFLYCDHMLTNLIVRKESKAGKLKSQIAMADIAQINDMKGSDTKLAIWAKGLCLELEAQTRIRRDQFIESLSFFLAIKRR